MSTGLAPTLAALQDGFRDYVLTRTATPPAWISGTPGAAVYAEAFLLRLTEALTTDYPALRALLGEEAFATLARDYAHALPPSHFSIRWFGRRLPAYLRATAPHAAEPCLAELAEAEWLIGEAFDAAEATALGAEALRAIDADDWGHLVLGFHPTLRRLDLRFDVFALRRALADAGGGTTIPAPGCTRPWVVWRRELEVQYRALDPAEAVALDALRGGASLAEAGVQLVERAGVAETQAPVRLAGWLGAWLGAGWIATARIADTREDD